MLSRLKSYIVLPSEITDFERSYLKRINKIALYFFLGHLPAFALVAAIAGTGPLRAIFMTSLVLVGPVIAYRTLRNPRTMSIVSGFTAMCLGGLLVHFGRGPMQIEMHFYFFVLIALLAVFANPIAVITAAVTVALHHLIIFLVLPRSVFNYDASIWAVAVHALFVVLESVAACFVARSFFDNVIGLERIVANRTKELDGRNRAMGLVLDNVDQGFLTISLDGAVDRERSAITDGWLGAGVEGAAIWDILGRLNPDVGKWLQMSWDALAQDILPADVAIDQFPTRIARGQQVWSLRYKPIMNDAGSVAKVLLVMTDVTDEVKRERAEVAQRDFQRVISHITRDRAGFVEFFQESEGLVAKIEAGDLDTATVRRLVHTLKGNCALFGLSQMVAICHDAETAMQDEREPLSVGERQRITEEWRGLTQKLSEIMGGAKSSLIEVDERELDLLMVDMRGKVTREEIGQRLLAWKLEPTERRLQRVATQIRATAARLGMTEVDVPIQSNSLRLASAPLREFWGAFTHAVRNALDHGIESAGERTAVGKPAAGQIRLATSRVGENFVVEISDDGRGIDWDAVRKRAAAVGLPHDSRDDLSAALFHDGLSTKEEVTEISGRGVGMGALKAACTKAGGRIDVASVPGRGTTLKFSWPWNLFSVQVDEQRRSA
jgi:two-component system chemotaxis sensor kinase CheA